VRLAILLHHSAVFISMPTYISFDQFFAWRIVLCKQSWLHSTPGSDVLQLGNVNDENYQVSILVLKLHSTIFQGHDLKFRAALISFSYILREVKCYFRVMTWSLEPLLFRLHTFSVKLNAGVTEYVKESHWNYQCCFDDPTCGLHEMWSVVEKECVGHISDVLTTCDTYYPKFEIRKGLQSSVCTCGIPN
jgi:hypothetical protein